MNTRQTLPEIEQRHAQAVLTHALQDCWPIVEQDVPWLIGRVRELEADLLATGNMCRYERGEKEYAEARADYAEQKREEFRLTWTAEMKSVEARAESAEKERDALRQQVANLTYSNESHRKCAELWRAAAIERDQLRDVLDSAKRTGDECARIAIERLRQSEALTAALAVAREAIGSLVHDFDAEVFHDSAPDSTQIRGFTLGDWRKLRTLLSQLAAEGAGTISDGGVTAQVKEAGIQERQVSTGSNRKSLTSEGTRPSENLSPTSAGQPGEGKGDDPDAMWIHGLGKTANTWHNPANLTRDQIGAGYRPLTVEEAQCVPEGAEVCAQSAPNLYWSLSGNVRTKAAPEYTYRIRTAAPPTATESAAGTPTRCACEEGVTNHLCPIHGSEGKVIAERDAARRTVAERDAEVAQLREKLRDLNGTIVSDLAERDAEVDSLKCTVMNLDAQRLVSERGWKRVERERDEALAQLAREREAREKAEAGIALTNAALSASDGERYRLADALAAALAELRDAKSDLAGVHRSREAWQNIATQMAPIARAEIALAFDALADIWAQPRPLAATECFRAVAAKLREAR